MLLSIGKIRKYGEKEKRVRQQQRKRENVRTRTDKNHKHRNLFFFNLSAEFDKIRKKLLDTRQGRNNFFIKFKNHFK